MWRITADGRRTLITLAARCGGRAEFGVQVGIGKNQVKPLLDDPDHQCNKKTLEKLQVFCGGVFYEGAHYELVRDDADSVQLRLARDRVPSQNLTRHDQRGIERLYEALYQNPRFAHLRSALDTPAQFHKWFDPWNGASEDMPSEQFFVYRVFRDKVISFLFGERQLIGAESPFEIFALWYLVGITNAFYEGSPVGLEAEDEKMLPLGERAATADMTIRLLEVLRDQKSVSYLVFEVLAEELKKPGSYERLLLRVYAHTEDDVRRHFAGDHFLCDARFYVLNFPYRVPRSDGIDGKFVSVEHRLVCCPLLPRLRPPFQQRFVSAQTIEKLLVAIYQMYWNYYDKDAPEYENLCGATENELMTFRRNWVEKARYIGCTTLQEYVRDGFGNS